MKLKRICVDCGGEFVARAIPTVRCKACQELSLIMRRRKASQDAWIAKRMKREKGIDDREFTNDPNMENAIYAG
jgi:hypothetical protein